MGVVDGQSTSRSPGLSDQPVEKKEDKKATSSKSVKPDKSVKSSSHRPSSSDSTDQKLEVMEQKWSDRFNRLEALLLAKTLDRPQEPVFTAVRVTPTNVISTEPYLKPSDRPSHRPSTTTLPATDPASSAIASKAGSDISQPSQRPGTSGVSDQSTVQKHVSGALDITRKDTSSSESDADSVTSDRPPIDLYPEEGELSDEHDVSFTDPDQSLSEEQYNLHAEVKKDNSDSVKSWNTGSSRLNSTYLRIARQAGTASNPPLSRPISQETLRKWERLARESSVICNQAAGFNHCLLKVQQNMQSQLKTIRTESNGKSASKICNSP